MLVLEGKSREEKKREKEAAFEELSIEEHMLLYTKQGMDKKEAMKQVAKDRGIEQTGCVSDAYFVRFVDLTRQLKKNLFNFGIDPNWLFLYTLERVRKRKLLGGRLKWQVYH